MDQKHQTTQQDKHLLPEPSQPVRKMFALRHPTFLAGMQQGAELFQQEHSQDTCLKELAPLEFYQDHLTPFVLNPVKNAGDLLGWMRAFLESKLPIIDSARNAHFIAGYINAHEDWLAEKKDEQLTDIELAELLVTTLAPDTLTTIRTKKTWYTTDHQIGYAFGLVCSLLTSPDIQIAVEHPDS